MLSQGVLIEALGYLSNEYTLISFEMGDLASYPSYILSLHSSIRYSKVAGFRGERRFENTERI